MGRRSGVQWSTYNEEDYLRLKAECEELGFTYWNTSDAYTGVSTSYYLKDLAVMFLMETIDKQTIYVINLRDLPEKLRNS